MKSKKYEALFWGGEGEDDWESSPFEAKDDAAAIEFAKKQAEDAGMRLMGLVAGSYSKEHRIIIP